MSYDPGPPLATRPSGTKLLYATLGAMFHLERTTPEDGERFEQVNAIVNDWFGSELRWTLNSAFGAIEPYRPEDLEYLAAHPSSLKIPETRSTDPATVDLHRAMYALERANFALAFHGGERMNDASPYSYRYYSDTPSWDDRRKLAPSSMLRITVPITWPLEDFSARICAVAARLRLRWGAAGLTYSGWEIRNYNDTRQAIYAHARRYPGFDVGMYATLVKEWHEAIRTVSWLTFLGPAFAERLAERSGARIESRGDVEVFAQSGAIVLRAGTRPDAGDQNRLRLPVAYVHADEMVRPVRARGGIDFMPPWSEAETEKWLCRFEKRIY
jgi:hypothetical protein